jgi:Prokaryotic metallothionein
MVLLRILLLCLFVYVVYMVVKSAIRRNGKNAAPEQLGEAMVLDPQCQTYVPRSEAVAKAGRFFCSEECARRFLAS